MFHYQGYSYEEISLRIGAPLGTVKSRLNRIRSRLNVILQDDRELLSAQT